MKTTITTGKIYCMKNSIITGILLAMFFAGCHNVQVKEVEINPKALVEAVTFTSGQITDEISLQAQSAYLTKNIIKAPVNSYVQRALVLPGDKVQAGQTLFEIITKEKKAAENLNDSIFGNLGTILIKAGNAGMVGSMTCQTGDYVTEGTAMCTISNVNSLVFMLQVPFELNRLIKTGAPCSITLPDESSIPGTVKSELDQMSLSGQTRQYLVKPQGQVFIPENLLATVRIVTKTVSSPQILPVACVLSDEMMQNFWVMKLINDSTAVKVNVKTGLKNKDEVEISEPIFTPGDFILSAGNYGLADTAFVHVEKR